jgi:glucokinase
LGSLPKSGTFAAGIDLGGTNIAVGLLDHRGRLVAKGGQPTRARQGMKKVAVRMAESLLLLLKEKGISKSKVRGVGIGSPGPLHTRKGIILQAPNLPGATNFPLRKAIAARTGLKTLLENDANAAAYGELMAGAGKGAAVRNMLMLTLGTGVGGAIILDRRLYHGGDTAAGELGHVSVNAHGPTYGSPLPGSLEAYASARGIARRGRELVKLGKGKKILKFAGGRAADIDAKAVYLAFKAGDAAAAQVWRETAHWLGVGLAGLINVFNPDMIVLGGGVMKGGRELLAMSRRTAARYAFKAPLARVKIVPARLGDDAGIIGAAALVDA